MNDSMTHSRSTRFITGRINVFVFEFKEMISSAGVDANIFIVIVLV